MLCSAANPGGYTLLNKKYCAKFHTALVCQHHSRTRAQLNIIKWTTITENNFAEKQTWMHVRERNITYYMCAACPALRTEKCDTLLYTNIRLSTNDQLIFLPSAKRGVDKKLHWARLCNFQNDWTLPWLRIERARIIGDFSAIFWIFSGVRVNSVFKTKPLHHLVL